MSKQYTLTVADQHLLEEYNKANAAFLVTEKALYDSAHGDEAAISAYRNAYDARLHAGALFAQCVSLEVTHA